MAQQNMYYLYWALTGKNLAKINGMKPVWCSGRQCINHINRSLPPRGIQHDQDGNPQFLMRTGPEDPDGKDHYIDIFMRNRNRGIPGNTQTMEHATMWSGAMRSASHASAGNQPATCLLSCPETSHISHLTSSSCRRFYPQHGHGDRDRRNAYHEA
ncbi:uncharacterized protein LOC108102783 [Drosophila eugracilis]|uniref:uncharacterized protein LOC108102783 n=1 Tax=Drosophila eugracilis TaxID=29029 RepID=UPI0007E72532|nr:uncharacterized protein LOC108102783 [Drosophila eugracilis]